MKKHAAFTLIELLVVVAIIATLIAILLPSMNKAMGAAQSAVCLSSQRQIGLGWKAYVVEHRGALFDYTLNHADRNLWTESLRNHVSEVSAIVVCPTTENPPSDVGLNNVGITGVRIGGARVTWVEARAGYNVAEGFERASYGYNNNMHPKSTYNTAEQRYQSLTDIREAHNAPILGDADWRGPIPGTTGTIKLFPSDLDMPQPVMTGANADGVWRYATNRHGFQSNILFADGHVESIDLPDLWRLKWHKTYDTATEVSGAP